MRVHLAGAAAAVALFGVTPPAGAQQRPTFRSAVELATFDVAVVGKDGQPAADLTADDFLVSIDGHETPVRALEYIAVDAPAAAVPAPIADGAAPPTPPPPSPFRIIVFVIDDLSFRPGPMSAIARPALDMLPMLAPADYVGVVTTSGLGPVVNPTRDRDAVREALLSKSAIGRGENVAAPFVIGSQEAIQIVRGESDVLEHVAERECPVINQFPSECIRTLEVAARRAAGFLAERTARQFQSYQHIADALRSAPAPKIIIAISAGVAASAATDDLGRQINSLSQAAAESGITLYALTEVVGGSDVFDLSSERAAVRRHEANFLTSGIQTLAGATGGEGFLTIGSPKRFVKRIVAETSGFYRLGVPIPPGTAVDTFARAEVKVRRKGLTVRANRHIIAGRRK